MDSPLTDHRCIHSVVLPGDPFPPLSVGHITELAAMISYFAQHDALRRRICRRPVSSLYAAEIWNLLEESLHNKEQRQPSEEYRFDSSSSSSTLPATKLVPPGQLWRLVKKKKNEKDKRKGKLWRLVPTKKPNRKEEGKGGTWILERAPTRDFLALSLEPLALDLTQHVPTQYEACLKQASQ